MTAGAALLLKTEVGATSVALGTASWSVCVLKRVCVSEGVLSISDIPCPALELRQQSKSLITCIMCRSIKLAALQLEENAMFTPTPMDSVCFNNENQCIHTDGASSGLIRDVWAEIMMCGWSCDVWSVGNTDSFCDSLGRRPLLPHSPYKSPQRVNC